MSEKAIAKHLHRMIDHTLLQPAATETQIRQLCREAEEHQFFAVCVHPHYVPLARRELQQTDVKVCTVVGFPLGLHALDVKRLEASLAVEDGADELDYVINMAHVKNGNWRGVEDEMAAMRRIKEEASRPLVIKAILETGYLTDEELVRLCQMAVACGLDFVKTSTGFGPGGATVAHVALMRQVVGDRCGVKASGGIRTKDDAVRMVQAGANRIGTSAGLQILQQVNGEK
ncbi:MAG: deoxyribose-phosphate aldolase [Bacillaceae bacterium G1]|nr:deoxyribose-phosphate aldolase [Bacillota bacterium]OJF17556.1 MAG: deoxyribose-phosphate aldolase [Bacillaceae bacterium G1]